MDRQTDGQTDGIAIASTALAMRALQRALRLAVKMADTVSQNCDSPSPIGWIGPSALQYYIFYLPSTSITFMGTMQQSISTENLINLFLCHTTSWPPIVIVDETVIQSQIYNSNSQMLYDSIRNCILNSFNMWSQSRLSKTMKIAFLSAKYHSH